MKKFQETFIQTLFVIGVVCLLAFGFIFFPTLVAIPDAAGRALNWGWKTYSSLDMGFAIEYPPDFSVDGSYAYTGLGSSSKISGVAFLIPPSFASGTNLSSADTKFSVEEISSGSVCSASRFLFNAPKATTITDKAGTFSFAVQSDAGAGNVYTEYVYAIPNSSPCVAVRYFIHSTNIDNYSPGTVKEFDTAALLKTFDAMRLTLSTVH